MLDYMDSSLDSVNSDISFSEDIYDHKIKQNIKETISNIKRKENKSRLVNNLGDDFRKKVTWMTFYKNLVQGVLTEHLAIKELKMRMYSLLTTANSARNEKKDEYNLYDYKFKYEEKKQKSFVNNILTKFNDPLMLEKNKMVHSNRITKESERNIMSKQSTIGTKFGFLFNRTSTKGDRTMSPNTSNSDTNARTVDRRKTIQDIITPGRFV
jgi:hypothetical protein